MAKVKKTETELPAEPLENKEETITLEEVVETTVEAAPVITTEETEVDFLEKILRIQNEGGFGLHLNGMITERIKKIKG